MPPQNVPLRHIGYFELQALENQQILRQPASELPYLPGVPGLQILNLLSGTWFLKHNGFYP